MRAYFTIRHRVIEILSYVLIVTALILTAVFVMTHADETVITHYNWRGEADGWGSAASALILPAMILVMNILMTLIGRFCPTRMINLPVRLKQQNAAAVYGDTLMLMFLLTLELSVYCLFSSICDLFGFAELAGVGIFVLLPAVFITIIVEMILTVRHNNA